MNKASAKLQFIASMFIFGTIGIFVRGISASSGVIAMVRGFIGSLFLLTVLILKKSPPDTDAIKKNGVKLVLSGIFIGINWILLFESYRYTTIAVSTLCYYLAPVFVIIASPFLFNEKITLKKGICILTTLIGAALAFGVFDKSSQGSTQILGAVLAVGSAVFYATVIIMNKKITGISPYDKTLVQLASAAIIMVPYVLFKMSPESISFDSRTIVLLLVVGVVHTGFAYQMYFGTLEKLKAQTAALFSYIDPISAVIISALVLKEAISILTVIGAVLILGSAIISDSE